MKILKNLILFTSLFAMLCGCSHTFLEDAAKSYRTSLEAKKEIRERKLANQSERNRKLAQRNAVIEIRIQALGAPQDVKIISLDGFKSISYIYEKITINQLINVLGTPDDVMMIEKGVHGYIWGSYVAMSGSEVTIISKINRHK